LNLGFIRIGMSVSTKTLKKDLKTAGSDLADFANRVTGIGGAAAAIGGALTLGAGVAAFADMTRAGSDLNEQLSKVSTVFGEASSVITTEADRMASKFGIVKTEFIDGAAQIGILGKAAGLSQAASADLGSEFAKLAIDASSFFNVPVADSLQALSSGLSGEAEPLKRFGVLMNEAAVKAEILRLKLAGAIPAGAGEEAQKVLARVSLIRAGLADASGDLERTSGGVANLGRSIAGRVENLKADIGISFQSIGQSLLGGVGLALEKLGGVIDGNKGALQAWAETAVQSGGIINKAIGWMGVGIGFVADAVVGLRIGFKFAQVGISKAIGFVLDGLKAFADGLATILNLIPGVKVKANAAIGAAAAAVKQTAEDQARELAQLTSQPFPSEKIKSFFDEIQAAADKASKATAAAAKEPALAAPAVAKAKAPASFFGGPIAGGIVDAVIAAVGSAQLLASKVSAEPSKLAGATELGSREARSAVLDFQRQGRSGDPIKQVAETSRGQLVESKKQTALLRSLGSLGAPTILSF
jgi:hypothetical protein